MEESLFNLLSWIDIFVFIVVLRTSYVGFKRGAVGESILTLGIIALILFISRYFNYYTYISQFLVDNLNISENFSNLISFLIVIIVGILLVWLFSKIATCCIEIIRLRKTNKILGILVGAFKGLFVCSVIFWILTIPRIETIENSIKSSFSGEKILNLAPTIIDGFSRFFDRII